MAVETGKMVFEMKGPVRFFFAAVSFCFLFSNCKKEPLTFQYLFLGHPYDWKSEGDRIDPRLEKLSLASFDQVWLGGDVCARLTEKPSTLVYLDSVFHFKKGNVHWAYGNHDLLYGNREWIEDRTGRPEFYAVSENGVCIAVINTQLFIYPRVNPPADFCARLDAQFDFLKTLADTISAPSHLVLLHHYCLMTNGLSGGNLELGQFWNFYEPNLQVACTGRGTFEEKIYPLLKKVQQKGVRVILVGGDFGMRAKTFQYQTADGIWFLGSGINNSVGDPATAPEYVTNFDPDKILLFEHRPEERALDWKFIDLDSLLTSYH